MTGDLAELVRDKTLAEVKSGKLKPTLQHGLMAQSMLDKREARAADRQLAIRIAAMLGGGLPGPGVILNVTPQERLLEALRGTMMEPEFDPGDLDAIDEDVELASDAIDSLVTSNIVTKLQQGRWDMRLFSTDVLGVDPHTGQKALFDLAVSRLSDGYSPAYLTVCCSAGNRAGKTLGLTVVVCRQTLYKMGRPAPVLGDDSSLKSWSSAPYDWYHFGISQEVTELVHLEMRRILQGVHEAQKGQGCPLTESLGDDVAEWDKKERGEWAWFKWSPLLGGAEVHFRTTGEKALSTLGRDMDGWSWDEPAFDPNLTFIFDEVLNLRRMSTGGQAILIATATEGSQAYEELWQRGDALAPRQAAGLRLPEDEYAPERRLWHHQASVRPDVAHRTRRFGPTEHRRLLRRPASPSSPKSAS